MSKSPEEFYAQHREDAEQLNKSKSTYEKNLQEAQEVGDITKHPELLDEASGEYKEVVKQKIRVALHEENYDLAEELFRKLRVHIENPEKIALRELKEKLSPEYISEFSKEGVARVKRDNKWFLIRKTEGGMIETTGDRFDNISPFHEGIACVRQDYKWFFIDEDGQEITKERFNGGGIFEGKAQVLKGGKWFFFDLKKGKLGERVPLKENTSTYDLIDLEQ